MQSSLPLHPPADASASAGPLEREQLSLFAGDEASLYHCHKRFGFFSVLYRHRERTHQRSFRLSLMPEVLRALPRDRDTWISQAEFAKPVRRVVHLARIGVAFIDLDTYNTHYKDWEPERIAQAFLLACEDQFIPLPSLIIYSGRGLQVKWLLDNPAGRAALPRWNALQRTLVDRFRDFGADPQAKDAARVLRVVQTVNTRSGEVCRVIWVNKHGSAPDGVLAYDFEEFADEVLPFTRDEVEAYKAAARPEPRKPQLRVIEGRKPAGSRRLDLTQLAWDRLEDLRRLAALRNWTSGAEDGMRNNSLWLATSFMGFLIGHEQLYREMTALAREWCPEWPLERVFRVTRTTLGKVAEHHNGVTTFYRGRRRSPIYTPSNQYLIDLLKITGDEERQLKTIISQDEKRRRDAVRTREKRRAEGMRPRSEYEATANQRREQAKSLRASGLSWAKVGEQLGISADAARKLASR